VDQRIEQNISRLPPSALAKLADLEIATDNALDAMQSASARFSKLSGDSDGMREKLTAARDSAAARHNELSRLLHHVHQFLAELKLPPNATIEMVPAPDVALKANEKVTDALEAARSRIASLKQQLLASKQAPLPLGDRRDLIEAFVALEMRRAAPAVNFTGDMLRLSWHDASVTSCDDALGMLCWFDPGRVVDALSRDLGKSDPARALSAAARKARIVELEAQLLDAERNEESLIQHALDGGIIVARRVDADPRAVLGISVAAAKAQAA
jgi:hypothetical protein